MQLFLPKKLVCIYQCTYTYFFLFKDRMIQKVYQSDTSVWKEVEICHSLGGNKLKLFFLSVSKSLLQLRNTAVYTKQRLTSSFHLEHIPSYITTATFAISCSHQSVADMTSLSHLARFGHSRPCSVSLGHPRPCSVSLGFNPWRGVKGTSLHFLKEFGRDLDYGLGMNVVVILDAICCFSFG